MCGVTSIEENPEKNSIIAIVKKYIPFVTAYAFFCSGIYLYIYWTNFGINVFEYASPGNIFTLALPWLVGGILFLFTLLFIVVYFYDLLKNIDRDTTKGKFIAILIFIICVMLIVYMIASVGLYLWLESAIPLGFFGAYVLNWIGFFPEITNFKVRCLIYFFIVAMSPIAHEIGERRATAIISGSSYSYTEYAHQSEKIPQKVEQKLRYIGKIGENFFFYEPEGASTVITTINHLGVLQLHKYEKSGS
jgi:hypothetical protein